MTDKMASPFTGIKLTDPATTPVHGLDQRLFAPHPTSTPALQPQISESTKEGRNLGSKEARKVSRQKTAAIPTNYKELFDIRAVAYRNNTYAFTDEELQALEDLSIELRRQYDVRATKNSLIRLGLHLLLENHRAHKAASFAVQRLRKGEKTAE